MPILTYRHAKVNTKFRRFNIIYCVKYAILVTIGSDPKPIEHFAATVLSCSNGVSRGYVS